MASAAYRKEGGGSLLQNIHAETLRELAAVCARMHSMQACTYVYMGVHPRECACM